MAYLAASRILSIFKSEGEQGIKLFTARLSCKFVIDSSVQEEKIFPIPDLR